MLKTRLLPYRIPLAVVLLLTSAAALAAARHGWVPRWWPAAKRAPAAATLPPGVHPRDAEMPVPHRHVPSQVTTRDEFAEEPEMRRRIPDGKTEGLVDQWQAATSCGPIAGIQVDLRVRHPRPSDLEVTLTHDAATVVLHRAGDPARVRDRYSDRGPAACSALRALVGQRVDGAWQLRVADTRSGQTGTFHGKRLRFDTSRIVPLGASAAPKARPADTGPTWSLHVAGRFQVPDGRDAYTKRHRFEVPLAPRIVGIRASIAVEHPRPADVEVALIHPDGTVVVLHAAGDPAPVDCEYAAGAAPEIRGPDGVRGGIRSGRSPTGPYAMGAEPHAHSSRTPGHDAPTAERARVPPGQGPSRPPTPPGRGTPMGLGEAAPPAPAPDLASLIRKPASGLWKLRVRDVRPGESGALTRWRMIVRARHEARPEAW